MTPSTAPGDGIGGGTAVIDRTELAPGYSVSRLIHGGWQLSAGHRLSGPELDDVLDLLVASAERGVTTFDCADIYTGVEELYGRFLRRWRSTSVSAPIQIHTKLVPDESALATLDRGYVERIVHRSLRRLGVERLDLVQFFWWRDEIPGMEEAALWLSELRDAGKVRHVAATNLSVDRLRRIRAAGVELVSNQVQYSVLDRRPAARQTDWCADTGASLIAYGALAGGFLTGRWVGADEPGGALGSRSLVKYRLIIDEAGGWQAYQALLATLDEIAAEKDVTIPAVALRFVLQQPGVSAVVAGATRAEQMRANARAFTFRLTGDDLERIRAHTRGAPGPSGDVFGLESDRHGPHGRIMKYDLNRSAT